MSSTGTHCSIPDTRYSAKNALRPAGILLLLGALACTAQDASKFVSLEGHVAAFAGTPLAQLSVEAVRADGSEPPARAPVNGNGGFSLAYLRPGSYTVRVLDAENHEIVVQPLVVGEFPTMISIPLPDRPTPPNPGGVVSVGELRAQKNSHKPDRKARRALEEARRFADKGDHARAAEALQRAIALDPDYAEAHAGLGAEYIRIERFEDAARELRRAIELAPGEFGVRSNLALALLRLGLAKEAGTWARSALALRPDNVRSRYLLGLALSRDPATEAEGIRDLEMAASAMPAAHWNLALIHRAAGRVEMAKKEAQQYLATFPGASRSDVDAWISTLR